MKKNIRALIKKMLTWKKVCLLILTYLLRYKKIYFLSDSLYNKINMGEIQKVLKIIIKLKKNIFVVRCSNMK